MTDQTIRIAQPRRWASLALAGATASLAAGAPGLAGHAPGVTAGPLQPPAVLVQAEGGEAGEIQPLASAEGGEGGEAGAAAGQPPDVAYLSQLSIVEGHMIAAVKLYDKGLKDDAVALSYHPEAEMMDTVRAALADHGAADITPAMTALSEAMEAGMAPEAVQARLGDARAVVAAGQAVEADEIAVRFTALVVLVKAAAAEYEGSITDGKVQEPMAWHEAWAFLAVAKNLATGLAELPDDKAKAAAVKITQALAETDAVFGDIDAVDMVAGDAGALLAVAGRVELAASQVRH
jgi:hypothetical protein